MTESAVPPRPPGFWKARTRSAFVLGVAVLVGVGFLLYRSAIDLARPVPWADEGSFLFPALAFRDAFTLFAPEINPERHVLWMPPGFMILQGLIFEFVPFSLSASRTLSALFLSGAFFGIAMILRRFVAGPVAVLLFPTFLFSPIFEMVGNVARMEALVLLLSTVGFVLVARGRAAGVAVLLLGPLVHPNALFPAAFGIPYFLLVHRGRAPWTRGALALVAFAILAWAAYAVYVLTHLEAFRIDMWNQMKFKQFVSMEDGGPLVRARVAVVSGPIIALVLLFRYGRRCAQEITPLLVLAACWTTQTLVASGWLYEVYALWSVLLVSVASLETLAKSRLAEKLSPVLLWSTLVVAAALLVAIDGKAVTTPFAVRSLDRATVKRAGFGPRYFEPEDGEVVRRHLASLAAARPIKVQFVPDGEALLFTDLRSPRLGFVQQTFYTGGFNVAVVHDSAWCPTYVRDLEFINVVALHHFAPAKRTILRTRDGSESWTVYEWPELSESRPPPLL
ncbi:MAG TPA: hypothetical protein VHE30_27925 [Polyangiaceae bacterium]|nr:hypothetical protein [Polyangiaceae bacterium]